MCINLTFNIILKAQVFLVEEKRQFFQLDDTTGGCNVASF